MDEAQSPEDDDSSDERRRAEVEQRVEATLIAKLNLADFQNAVPLLRELAVVNDAPEAVKDLELAVSSLPPFLRPKVWHLDALAAAERCRITDIDLQLDGGLLTRLTESEKAIVAFVLRRRDGGEELARREIVVELLPRNQWGGLAHLPDMVAAFVQPNEPAVERLLKQATEILRKNGKSASLDGYKGGAKRAWEIASAVWSAVVGMGLAYALPPASFEHTGQKVRGPGQVAESGLATCLDLALLFCAALEQAGLNPLLVFTKGHAFAGVWLKAEEFSTTVVDDVTALRKRLKLGEMLLFETTLATQQPAPTFVHATERGALQVSEAHEETFELAVDVRRARMQRIKPLASAEPIHVVEAANPPRDLAPQFAEAPDLPEGLDDIPSDTASLRPEDRLARWQRKLLDLSMRNNLLNFRVGKKALKLEAPDPAALEDMLAEGQAIKLLPRPDLMDGADPRNQAIFEGREREDLRRGHALDALKRREVFVGVEAADLEARLVDLYRTARSTLQEGGANTLFLALGFLSWTRDDRDGQRFRAPLVLVPVTLNRRSVRSGFTLTLHDDEPRFNPTLIEMLRQDFRLDLGVATGELPKDDSGLAVGAIWKKVSHAIKDIKGWEVTEDVVVAMFSFAKYLMWKDLVERTDQLRQNAVVRHLIDTPRESYPPGAAFPNPRKLDAEYAPEQTFCPLPADSSQLSAVMAGSKGKDFVLLGPPGTGKSQTIANLIAQCLAEGKRVLFVSEKIAALDVVYRRLREVGLGEFCLELHSNKARKLDVLGQLQKTWSAQGSIDPDVWRAEAQRLKKLRTQLNAYVERLHVRHPNGATVHDAIGRLAAGEGLPVLGLSWPSPHAHGPDAMETMREIVDRIEVNAREVGHGALRHNPLSSILHSDWSPAWQQRIIDAARRTISAAGTVQQAFDRFVQAVGLPALASNRRVRGAVGALARALPQAAGRDWRFVLRPDARAVAERLQAAGALLAEHRELTGQLADDWSDATVGNCQRGLRLLSQFREVLAQLGRPWPQETRTELARGLDLLAKATEASDQLSVRYSDQVEHLNVVQLQRDWAKAEKAFWPVSWFGKRKIRAVLAATVAGEGESSDVAKDLRLLVKRRALRADIAALDPGPSTDVVWAGLKTRPELVTCALGFDAALRAARSGDAWDDVGFEPISEGRCGERLASEIEKLRTLRSIDNEIAGLAPLTDTTAGLWSGHTTGVLPLQAALQFQGELRAIRRCGFFASEHAAVAQGECGAAMAADHQRLRQRADVERRLNDCSGLAAVTAGLWNGLATRSDELDAVLRFHASLSAALASLATTPEEVAAVRAPIERLVGDGNALLEPAGPIVAAGNAYVAAWSELQPTFERFAAAGSLSAEEKTTLAESPLADVVERCRGVVDAESRLRAWCAWLKVREEALEIGLAPLIAGIEDGNVSNGMVRKTFETDYCRWWLNAIVNEDNVIRNFVSAEHEKRIADFRMLDDRFTTLTQAWVRAGLCAELPQQDKVPKNSEWGILRHEMTKKKRHLPLRELLSRIPTALTQLTPCLLMSPLSIAQYLAADTTAFDLVVFDEASQIAIWDAIGAIARGKQVVMVGDPKQLPPTNFFGRAESDSDNEDVEGDLESILDECIGAGLPTMKLNWHYRSRHESLIAFSNHHYYDGSLVTFPSPVTRDGAVSFHPISGIYEKGGARINKLEAKALVADLVGRLKTPGFRESGLTVGVVTFNGEQQALIEDLLDEERRKDPSIESHFAETALEPVFVKNLESVQGDERDIMYFSITYGPDLGGAVSMNFGPMNRSGGERRLNVAITRARQELRVFSSLRPEQMDLARTQAIGVRDLKHFLEFAERGPRALSEATRGSLGDFESPFEEAVASALTKKGWQLHTQVGASSFRVDLAVVHPDAPGVYLTGIECDGATYHRSATARDRDKLREQVLRSLGWDIVRIWSTDWWIDKAGTVDKVHAALNVLLEASRAKRAREKESEAALATAAAVIAKAKDEGAAQVQETGARFEMQETLDLVSTPPKTEAPGVYAGSTALVPVSAPPDAGVLGTDFASVTPLLDASTFFDVSYDPVLKRIVAQVIDLEGPVRDAALARRVARAHGWQRTGSRIQDRVVGVASKMRQRTQEDVGVFFWAEGCAPGSAIPFRRAANGAGRPVDEICMEELVALASEVLSTGKTGDPAVAAMARELGVKRSVEAVRSRLENALRLASGS